jgi:N-acetyl sugar amidotransferase
MRCKKCVLSDKYPGISFDEKGICNFCNDFYKNIGYDEKPDFNLLENKLNKIFEKSKKIGQYYNCLVPLSGGKDSTYILYLCIKKYKLKTLAFTIDNGFLSNIGKQNITNAIDILGVDHLFIKPSWLDMKNSYKIMIENYGFSCVFCDHSIFYISRYIQNKFNIPLIILGGSPRTQGRPSKLLYRIDYNAIISAYEKKGLESIYFNNFPWFKSNQNEKNPLGKVDVDRISLPYYLDWPEETIPQILSGELKWQRKEEATEHVDCYVAKIKDYVANRIWGFTWQEIKYSDLIRDGQLIRKEALNLLKIDTETLKKEPPYFDEYLLKLDYTKSQFYKILKNINKLPFEL